MKYTTHCTVTNWIWTTVLMVVIYFNDITKCSIPCEFLYGGCKHNVEHIFAPILEPPRYSQQTFVPSPPGKQPRCAKPGSTFCEKIERYPVDLIKSLAAKANYNFRTLFVDESDGKKKESNAYSTVPFNHGAHVPTSNAQINIVNNGFNQSGGFNGYPNRQYPLDESAVHFVDPVLYAAFSDVNAYNPNEWWKRSARSGGKTGHKRKRRQTNPPAGTELCPTRSQFITPRAALNNRGEWKYVVNLDKDPEKYTQLVKSETCLTEECNGICSLPNGYTSRCEQKYVQKRLVALQGTGTELYTDIFWFPHCCVCQIAPDIR